MVAGPGSTIGFAETLAGVAIGWRLTVTRDGDALRIDPDDLSTCSRRPRSAALALQPIVREGADRRPVAFCRHAPIVPHSGWLGTDRLAAIAPARALPQTSKPQPRGRTAGPRIVAVTGGHMYAESSLRRWAQLSCSRWSVRCRIRAAFDKRTYFTFSDAVAVPGATLPAGKYLFRLADETSHESCRLSADGRSRMHCSLPCASNDSTFRRSPRFVLETAAAS